MKNIVKISPKDAIFEENEKIIDIVEKILELNRENQEMVLKFFNTKPNA